jgi:hypothetical protein
MTAPWQDTVMALKAFQANTDDYAQIQQASTSAIMEAFKVSPYYPFCSLDGPPEPPPGTPVAGDSFFTPGATPWILYRQLLQAWLVESTNATPTDPGPLLSETLAGPVATSTSASVVTINSAVLPGSPLVTIATSASAGSYLKGSEIVINGFDAQKNQTSQSLFLTQTGGGETLTSAQQFSIVTTINIAGQADTAGAFTFGVVSTAIAAANAFLAGLS